MKSINRSILQGCFLALATPSSVSGANAPMRFLFQSCDDLIETLEMGGANATDNSALQCG
jgi:ABC-type phosphate/phosphonate transport system substrate-binding protein